MPAQKRHSPSENLLNGDSSLQHQHHRRHQQLRWERGAEQEEEEQEQEGEGVERDPDDEEVKEEEDDDEEEEEEEDSDGSRSSDDPAKLPEWLIVHLSTLRSCVQCPICLVSWGNGDASNQKPGRENDRSNSLPSAEHS